MCEDEPATCMYKYISKCNNHAGCDTDLQNLEAVKPEACLMMVWFCKFAIVTHETSITEIPIRKITC